MDISKKIQGYIYKIYKVKYFKALILIKFVQKKKNLLKSTLFF